MPPWRVLKRLQNSRGRHTSTSLSPPASPPSPFASARTSSCVCVCIFLFTIRGFLSFLRIGEGKKYVQARACHLGSTQHPENLSPRALPLSPSLLGSRVSGVPARCCVDCSCSRGVPPLIETAVGICCVFLSCPCCALFHSYLSLKRLRLCLSHCVCARSHFFRCPPRELPIPSLVKGKIEPEEEGPHAGQERKETPVSQLAAALFFSRLLLTRGSSISFHCVFGAFCRRL